MSGLQVAVVGATGAVGNEIIRILEERDFPVEQLHLYASERSEGKNLEFQGSKITVKKLKKDSFEGIDVALFSAGASRSLEFAQIAVQSGAIVVDNSSAFRMEPNVPLVVPEVNSHCLNSESKIIANPNCSTIQLVVVLNPLHKISRIKRVVVSTYQAVSGAGQKAIDELDLQVKAKMKSEESPSDNFPHQIAFNCLPQIDIFLDGGNTKEELKMINETRKILEFEDLPLSATCVRVPVYNSHSESVNIEFQEDMDSKKAREILDNSEGIEVLDDIEKLVYPMPIDISGKDDVFVGRIRDDDSLLNTINLWVVSDNLRKGAALNAVQIAECLLKKNILDI